MEDEKPATEGRVPHCSARENFHLGKLISAVLGARYR